MGIDLMEHQKEALQFLGNGKILYGGVGSGKSAVALAYYVEHESPRRIIVITTAKKRDSLEWEGEAAKFGIGGQVDATLHGLLTVDSWNNIGHYLGLTDAFFIFDEQKVIGRGAWVKHFLAITKYNRWVLLSATPGDIWLDYAPIFIANGWYNNITDFKRQHVIYAPFVKFPKVLRYVGQAKLERLRNSVLVEMPYLKHTERILNTIEVEYDTELMELAVRKRWHPYEDRPIRDVGELFRVMRKIVNSDPSRLQTIEFLMGFHPKLIIFYNFDYELEILRALGKKCALAEWNGHRHEPIPTADNWVYLVQYTAGGEGWNCIETDSMVLYSLTYSYKNYIQCQGRIDRLDTPYTQLYYYILSSRAAIDKAVKKALDRKETFNELKAAKSMHLINDLTDPPCI